MTIVAWAVCVVGLILLALIWGALTNVNDTLKGIWDVLSDMARAEGAYDDEEEESEATPR